MVYYGQAEIHRGTVVYGAIEITHMWSMLLKSQAATDNEFT